MISIIIEIKRRALSIKNIGAINSIRLGFIFLLLLVVFPALGQVQKEDGTWWDNNLEFRLLFQNIQNLGEIDFCIYDTEKEMCTAGLMTLFEVRIFDSSDKEIWNSLWTGKSYELKFKKNFPEAAWFEIKAKNNFVVNPRTGTRIYQDKPLYLKVDLE